MKESIGGNAAQTLTAQEQAIKSGKKVLHETVTDRVLRMHEAIRESGGEWQHATHGKLDGAAE